MNADLKQRWLEALRSGLYPQARHVLERQDEHGAPKGLCCLGVLCRLAEVPTQPDADIETKGTPFIFPIGDFITPHFQQTVLDSVMPTPEWLRQIGLNREVAEHAARMNDQGESFEAIAAYLEESIHADESELEAAMA